MENKAKAYEENDPRRGDSFVLAGMIMEARTTGQSLLGRRDAVNMQSKSGEGLTK